MRVLYYLLLIHVMLFSSGCGKKKEFPATNSGKYGGVLRISTSQYFVNLFPPSINSMATFQVSNHIYEGLVKIDKSDLQVKPSLANWETSKDGLEYTFHLKQNVYFHNNPCFSDSIGRFLTAKDVETSFYLLCTYGETNVAFNQSFRDKIEGATEYFEASKTGIPDFSISGLKVVNDSTFQIKLLKPYSPFLYALTGPSAFIFPEEAFRKYGGRMNNNAVGTGPFILDKITADKTVHLIRNPRYWQKDKEGNQLPYLEGVMIETIEDPLAEFQAYKNNRIDFINDVPKDFIEEVFNTENKLHGNYKNDQHKPLELLFTQYCDFNMSREIFKNKKVRLAFNHAIDKNLIIDYVIGKSDFKPAVHGITPPGIKKNYENNTIKGYVYDRPLAQQLLAEAGYPGGENFPVLQMEVVKRFTPEAEAIKKMLYDALNITITILPVSSTFDMMESQKFGKSDLYFDGWYADYPDPETFLSLFYGKNVPQTLGESSYPNSTRYVNKEYDQYYEAGLYSPDPQNSLKSFLMAETILMNDPPIITLYHSSTNTLIKQNLKGYVPNPMEIREFAEVYFDK